MANNHVGVIARSSFERARSTFHWIPTIPKFTNLDFTARPFFFLLLLDLSTHFLRFEEDRSIEKGSMKYIDKSRGAIACYVPEEKRFGGSIDGSRSTSALEGRVTRSPGRGLYVVSSASWSALNLTAPPATRKLDAGRRVDSSPSVARSNAGVRGKRRDASVPDNPERPQTTRRNRCVPNHRRRNLRRVLPFIFLRFFCSHTLRRLWHRPTDTYVF